MIKSFKSFKITSLYFFFIFKTVWSQTMRKKMLPKTTCKISLESDIILKNIKETLKFKILVLMI